MKQNIIPLFPDTPDARPLSRLAALFASKAGARSVALGIALAATIAALLLPLNARALLALLGCALAGILARSGSLSLSTFLAGTLAYPVVVCAGFADEAFLSVGYEVDALLDVTLLRLGERVTLIHAAGFAASFAIFAFASWPSSNGRWIERYTWIAGAFAADVRHLFQSFRALRRKERDPGLLFGMLRLPSSWAPKNFLFSGVIGCGKTTFFKMLMDSAFKDFGRRANSRALVYDLKSEFYPFLLAAGLSARSIRIINPFDARCAWWDIASEITDEKTARQIAQALVPSGDPQSASRENSFFVEKARGIVAGIMINFQRHSPGMWTLADVALALRERKRYEAILMRDNDTATNVKSLEHADTRGDVMATMDKYRWKYEVAAALWDHAQKNGNPSFTIREWLSDGSILLLTQDKSGGEILNPIFQALLHAITEQIASQTKDDTRRTWFFLDEFPTLGRVPLISELLNTCRDRGAATAVTFQDVEQLREVYGPHVTNTIVGALKCKAVFKSAIENAKWAQEIFGKTEFFVERKNWGVTHGEKGHSSSTENTSTSREEVPLFRSEFFTYLDDPSPEAGFSAGIFLDGHAYAASYPFYEAIRSVPEPTEAAGFVPAPASWQVLEDWDEGDLKRLRLTDLLLLEEPRSNGQANGIKHNGARPKGPTIKIKR